MELLNICKVSGWYMYRGYDFISPILVIIMIIAIIAGLYIGDNSNNIDCIEVIE